MACCIRYRRPLALDTLEVKLLTWPKNDNDKIESFRNTFTRALLFPAPAPRLENFRIRRKLHHPRGPQHQPLEALGSEPRDAVGDLS